MKYSCGCWETKTCVRGGQVQASRRPDASARSASLSDSGSSKVWPSPVRPSRGPAPRPAARRRAGHGDGRCGLGKVDGGHVAPPRDAVSCSHSSSSATCHSGLPRSGVSCPFGSASSASTASGGRAPAAWPRTAEGVADHVQVRALQVLERRHREVALGPVDHLVQVHPVGGLLEHALAVVGGLQVRRTGRGQSTSSWSRKGTRPSRPQAIVMLSTRFTGSSTSITVVSSAAPGRWRFRLRVREVSADVPPRRRRSRRATAAAAARRRRGRHVGARGSWRAPPRRRRRRPAPSAGTSAIRGEDLVGTLAGLDHLDVLADLLGQQVERRRVMADHRLAHRSDRARPAPAASVRCRSGSGGGRCRNAGEQVGVPELVAALATEGLETDREGLQAVLAGLGEQADDQAGVPGRPDSRAPTGTSATSRALPPRSAARRSSRPPSPRSAPTRALLAPGRGAPGGQVRSVVVPSASIRISVPGESLRTRAGWCAGPAPRSGRSGRGAVLRVDAGVERHRRDQRRQRGGEA